VPKTKLDLRKVTKTYKETGGPGKGGEEFGKKEKTGGKDMVVNTVLHGEKTWGSENANEIIGTADSVS